MPVLVFLFILMFFSCLQRTSHSVTRSSCAYNLIWQKTKVWASSCSCYCLHFRRIQTGSCKQRSDVGAVPCMFGTGLLQTAGGRLLLSSFHKRDRNLPKPKPTHISQQLVMFWIICVSHSQTIRNTRREGESVYLLYFFYSLELHSPFALREKEGRC